MKQRSFLFWTIAIILRLIPSVALWSSEKNQDKKINLIEVNDTNWEMLLDAEWIIKFTSPICPCKNLEPSWRKLAKVAANINVYVGTVDVNESPGLTGRLLVSMLPTIFHVKNSEFRPYRGPHSGEAVLSFIQKQEWTIIEPLSFWFDPTTIHMSLIAQFFKLSYFIKDLKHSLELDFELSTWGVYALFVGGTVAIAASVGIIMDLLLDLVWLAFRILHKFLIVIKILKKNEKEYDDNSEEEDENVDANNDINEDEQYGYESNEEEIENIVTCEDVRDSDDEYDVDVTGDGYRKNVYKFNNQVNVQHQSNGYGDVKRKSNHMEFVECHIDRVAANKRGNVAKNDSYLERNNNAGSEAK